VGLPFPINRLAGLFSRGRPAGVPLASNGTPAMRLDRVVAQDQANRSGRPRERLPATTGASYIGKVWFLPYADTQSGETPAIRAAYREMPRNEMVKAALSQKVLAVAALDWQVQAKDPDNPRDREGAEFCRYNIERCPGGMAGIITSILLPHLIDGFQLAEKVVEVDPGREEPKYRGKIVLNAIKSKDPNFLRMRGDEFNNITHVESTLGRPPTPYSIQDFIYTRNLPLFENPLGTSDLRAAYKHYWMADTVSKLRAIHAEKYTSPFMLGEYEEQEDKPALESALAAARAGTWMAVPAGVKVRATTSRSSTTVPGTS
jgi:hypothetical protein